MSILSSLKGEFVTQDAILGERRSGSVFEETFLLRKIGDINQPVALVKLLLPHGVSLTNAHQVVNTLTADEAPRVGIPVSLNAITDKEKLASQLATLGVEAIPL